MTDIALDPTNSTVQKLNIARQKKDSGDQAFKLGNTKDGVLSYIPHVSAISSTYNNYSLEGIS